MNQNAVIALSLVAVVGAGLYLSRRPTSTPGSDDGLNAFSYAMNAPMMADDVVTDLGADSYNPASMSPTGSSVGPSAYFTPDAGPVYNSGPRRLDRDLR